MRTLLAACLVLSVATCRADAQQSVVGQARSVSLMTAIADFCPSVIFTNADVAKRYAAAFGQVGRSIATPAVWRAVLTREAARRKEEVLITGLQKWCEDQRRYVRELGVTDVFP